MDWIIIQIHNAMSVIQMPFPIIRKIISFVFPTINWRFSSDSKYTVLIVIVTPSMEIQFLVNLVLKDMYSMELIVLKNVILDKHQ